MYQAIIMHDMKVHTWAEPMTNYGQNLQMHIYLLQYQ